MKKFLITIIIILLIGFTIFYFFAMKEKEIPKVQTEEETVKMTKYYTYSTYLNMEATLELKEINFKDIKLTLYNGEYKDYELNYELNGSTLKFNLAEELNRGLYLDDIERSKYYLFVKITYENYEDETAEDEIKYYRIDNQTEYDKTTYYTMSKYNNEIIISSENEYPTLMFEVKENKNEEVVDIAIDPGHGGMDGGAEAFGSCERDFTYNLATKVGEKLQQAGYKIVYTRQEVSKNELIEEYNENGRAVIPSKKHAKYVLSIHFNSSDANYVKGLEVYSPIGINYDFAKSLVENITKESGLTISTRQTYKLEDGIYGHNFTESDIEKSLKGYEEKGYKPYDIKTYSNYYYMIRETGGIVTGAYVSDLNEKVGYNPYYNSNTGAESYILELGYITNENDLEIIKNNQEQLATGIANAISKNL